MQDVFTVDLDNNEGMRGAVPIDFMGIMDGHGPNGETVALFVANNLNDMVQELCMRGNHFLEAIETGCLELDSRIRRAPWMKIGLSGEVAGEGGTTCTAIWIRENKIYSCNVGDSRFIISYNGKAFAVTEDHKPGTPREEQRIIRAGGAVAQNRVNGILGVARSFGDFAFKNQLQARDTQQIVTALPDVFIVEVDPSIDFLVMASDGVWDVLSNQQVVDFVVEHIKRVIPLDRIATLLVDLCSELVPQCFGVGSDNITCIIAILKI